MTTTDPSLGIELFSEAERIARRAGITIRAFTWDAVLGISLRVGGSPRALASHVLRPDWERGVEYGTRHDPQIMIVGVHHLHDVEFHIHGATDA